MYNKFAVSLLPSGRSQVRDPRKRAQGRQDRVRLPETVDGNTTCGLLSTWLSSLRTAPGRRKADEPATGRVVIPSARWAPLC